VGGRLVGEEHGAELARHGVERAVAERERQGVGLPRQATLAAPVREAAKSSIGRLGSVARIVTLAGKALARARVATPVPAAVSSTREGARSASLAARSRA